MNERLSIPAQRRLCRVLFAPVGLTALFLRIKLEWNPSMLVSEEQCDGAVTRCAVFLKFPWCCEDEDGLGTPEAFAAGGDGEG